MVQSLSSISSKPLIFFVSIYKITFFFGFLTLSIHGNYIFAWINPIKENNDAGNIEFSGKNYEKAGTFYQEALRNDHKNPIILFNIANNLHQLSDFPNAKAFYNQAIRYSKEKKWKNQDIAQLYYNLGNNYYKEEDYQKAVETYKKALDLDQNDWQIKKNLELALQKLTENKKKNKNQEENQEEKQQNEQNNEKNQSSKSQTQPKKNQQQSPNTPPDSPNNENNQGQNDNNDEETRTMSLKRAKQILNSYENRQKKFENYYKYPQETSKQNNIKNW